MRDSLLCLIFLLCSTWSLADDVTYVDLPLEDLLQVEIGSLSKKPVIDIPGSVTIITYEMIEVTPARNLADLLEIYVPGFTYTGHVNSRIGMRGIMIDRNYKILLLINGKNMNNKSQLGADLEFPNWDLHDIERVEVIRGAGSVTHGPGAIAGIVNIVTKKYETHPRAEVGTTYVTEYQSAGMQTGWGHQSDSLRSFAYVSYRKTGGLEDHNVFKVDPATGAHGFVGKDYDPSHAPANHYGDVLSPQVKAHLSLAWPNKWTSWFRYTQADYPHQLGDVTKADYAGKELAGGFSHRRSFAAFLSKEYELSADSSLRTEISYDVEDFFMAVHSDASKAYNEGILNYPDDPGNVNYNSAEHEMFAKAIYSLVINDQLNLALGGSFSYEWVRPTSWLHTNFKDESVALSIGSRVGPDGRSIQNSMGRGFDTTTWSIMGEMGWQMMAATDLLLSSRVDKNKWSDVLFSPRAALKTRLDPEQLVKLIWQRSVRMNTLVEMYTENLYGHRSSPETLESVELVYHFQPKRNQSYEVSTFHQTLHALGWDGTKTVNLGRLKLVGMEGSLEWNPQDCKLGFNHSWTKLIRWTNAEGVGSQGISYSDYNVKTGTLELSDEGHALTNMPEQMSKAYMNLTSLPANLYAHFDVEVFWGFAGRKALQNLYQKAYDRNGGDATMNTLSKKLDDEGYGDAEEILNFSIGRDFSWEGYAGHVDLKAHNLLGFKRYGYDAGSIAAYPNRIAWVEEPPAWSLELTTHF